MAKNTFKTPLPEEQPQNEPPKLSAWQRFTAFSERQPIVQIILIKLLKYTLYGIGVSLVTVVLLKFVPVWITPTMIDRKITAIAEGRDSEIH